VEITAEADWKSRAAGLAAGLVAAGVLSDPAWVAAFAGIPRHVFTPIVRGTDGTTLVAGQPRWWEVVYSDEALLTQTTVAGEGDERQELPTSSSSKPAVMAVMLDRLDVHAGHRVLEVGTGTGYNTALLTHRLGEGNVYSLDIHPGLVAQARERLARIGQHPHLQVGDGAAGLVEHAPYDRIIVTCAITHVPSAWVRQLVQGGRLVAPLDAGAAGPLLVLDKTAPDEVSGHIDDYPAWFMPLRSQAADPLGSGHTLGFTGTGMAHYGTTALDPATLLTERPDLALFCWMHLPGLTIAGGRESGVVVAHTEDCMAEAQLERRDDGTWQVIQRGPRRLWDTIEHAVTTFEKLGRPKRGRFGVTALDDPATQYIWLDDPNGTYSFPLPPCPLSSERI
jgi:protein-L-isoaspartate(D-aspartate) O-methyltransferase